MPSEKRTPKAYTLDSTPYSAVVVCNLDDCQWRGVGHTKASAYRLVAAHLSWVHGEQRHAQECRARAVAVSRSVVPGETVSA